MSKRIFTFAALATLCTATLACDPANVDDGIFAQQGQGEEGIDLGDDAGGEDGAGDAGDGDGDVDPSDVGGDGDGDGDGEGMPGDDNPGDGENNCAETEVQFTQQIPTVQLLVDRSGSMTEDFGDFGNRWDALETVLFDAQGGLATQLDGHVRFGLTTYTSENGWEGGTCPMLDQVDPTLNNADAMHDLYVSLSPVSDTPTGESIVQVAQELADSDEVGPKVIIVVTDGEPDTCDEPNPQNGQDMTVEAAELAHGLGVKTFVVSVGTDVSAGHLQDLANAGQGVGEGDPDAAYFVGTDTGELVSSFESIVDEVRDCRLDLDGQLYDGLQTECEVLVNGQPVAYDDADGWKTNSSTQIELVGQACEDIQGGDVDISVSCSCDAYAPVG